MARQAVSHAVSDMWTVGNIPFAISFTSYLADIILAQGYLHEAISVYEHALQRTREQREDELAETAVLHLGLSELYHELDDMKAATSHLRRSEEMGEQIAFPPRATNAEAVLTDAPFFDEAVLTAAVAAAQAQAKLRTSKHRASADYRHEMIDVLLRRVLPAAFQRAGGKLA